MVITPLCIASMLMATCETNPIALTEGDNAFQIPYEEVDEKELKKEFNEAILSYLPNRRLLEKDVYEYLYGYDEYKKEQQRVEEEKRIAEEQKRLAELELKRTEEESYVNSNYRQTVYSVSEGEIKLGSGLYYGHNDVKVIDNVMHYNDSEYGWLPIYAISIDEVIASGQNSSGTWNIYGSVIKLKYNDNTWYGYIGDACGSCRYANKIDLWTYNVDLSLDVSDIDWKYVRKESNDKIKQME